MSENVSPKSGCLRAVQSPKEIGNGGGKAPRKGGAASRPKAVKETKKALSQNEIKEDEETRGEARRDQNRAIGICPFFKQDRGCGRVSCEGASFHFPDAEARREYVYRFCAHPEGYKDCPLQVTLDHYYERKYAHHE